VSAANIRNVAAYHMGGVQDRGDVTAMTMVELSAIGE
jgi:hypothetical protein